MVEQFMLASMLLWEVVAQASPVSAPACEELDQGQTCGTVLLQQRQRQSRTTVEAEESYGQPLDEVHPTGWQHRLRAAVAEDGRSAVVRLPLKGGRSRDFLLHLTSIYSNDAAVVVHTGAGQTDRGGSAALRHFSSSLPGHRAKASIDRDGSISGLFQHGQQLLRIKPMPVGLVMDAEHDGHLVVSALQASEGRLHSVQAVGGESVMARLQNLTEQHDHGLEVAVDDVGPAPDATTGEAPGSPLTPLSTDSLPDIEASEQDWAGVRWFPGCFTGDEKLHALRIGVAADFEAWRLFGARLQGIIESIVSEASLVYEAQMNIRLEIGDLQMYQAPGSSSVPGWASASCVAGEEVRQKFELFSRWSPPSRQAVWHMFTGCGNGFGTIGLAYVGSTCRRSFNTGVNMLRNFRGRVVEDSWTTFAHELGHSLAARHSFEEGQGRTGGIMDYADGKLNGVYQFNTKYRKAEMCNELTSKKPFCGNRFATARTAAPTPAPTPEPTPEPIPLPTPEPTQAPTPEPTCADEDGNCRFYTSYCNAENVKAVCKETCGLCEPTQAPTPEPTPAQTPEPTREPTPLPTPEPTQAPTPEPACADEDGNCRFYTSYCNAENVKAVCKKTCGLCCADEDVNCRFYTSYCNAENVKAVCKKTCGLC